MPTAIIGTYVGNAQGHTSREDCAALVTNALAVGYEHFDTALMYNNEAELGAALHAGGASGSAYVTTKVAHPNDPSRGHVACGYMGEAGEDATEGVLRNVRECTARLALGRPIDLVLLHWPGVFGSSNAVLNERKRIEMWRGLERAKEDGLCRSIGVSSFTRMHLEQLYAHDLAHVPVVNQLQCHPLHSNAELVQYCQDKGVVVTAWSPLGIGGALDEAPLRAAAERHAVTPATVALRWLVQRGIVPVPRSVQKSHMAANLSAVLSPGFDLDDNEMDAINALDCQRSVFDDKVSPDNIA